jgi:hypothetical protein
MAKINARGHRQVGPTLFTERDWKAQHPLDQDCVIYEGWRVRSDGAIQSRIIHSTNADGSVTKSNSGYRNVAKANVDLDLVIILRKFLARRNFRIVKES